MINLSWFIAAFSTLTAVSLLLLLLRHRHRAKQTITRINQSADNAWQKVHQLETLLDKRLQEIEQAYGTINQLKKQKQSQNLPLKVTQSAPQAKPCILVVDDDEGLREAIQFTLEYADYTVETAGNGIEGLQKFQEKQPDVVLLDIMMPGVDGWEVCQKIRAISDVPIIILTVLNKSEQIVRGLDYGADDFITKPFNTQVLLARTRAALRRAELEKQVMDSSIRLTQANRELETMLYTVSHDLKEPLRAIQNFASLVNRRYAADLDEKGQDYLARIDKAAKRLQTLINNILILSHAQQMSTPSESVASEQIVEDVLGQLQATIQETEATVQIDPHLPTLWVNRTWATRAIYNLIVNALKHTQPNQPPRLTISPYNGTKGIGLVIADRGPSVSPEDAERIFKLFQRAAYSVEGTGAGLAIVRRVAEKHNGHAWFEPRPEGGACFIITFGQPDSSAAHMTIQAQQATID